jgi:hypothetical protein
MKLRNWSLKHTQGMLLGLVTPLVIFPLVLLFMSWVQDYYFEQVWNKFMYNSHYRIKIITISIIANLGWFYLFLNREKFNFAMGIILGSMLYAPYVIYVKFF